jgi:orotate phosphoribosyltransferase-like protein
MKTSFTAEMRAWGHKELFSLFRAIEYGLHDARVEEIALYPEDGDEPLILHPQGLDWGQEAFGRRYRGDSGCRLLVADLARYVGGNDRYLNFDHQRYRIVAKGTTTYTIDQADWIESCARPHAASYWVKLTIEAHEAFLQQPDAETILEAQHQEAAKRMLSFIMPICADLDDTDKLIQVLEDKDRRVLDLSSMDEILNLTKTLGDKLIAFLEEKGHHLDQVAFLAIPRSGLIVLGYLAYLMDLTKYQVAPLLTWKADFFWGHSLYFNAGQEFEAIVLVDDVAGLGHTLKRATKAVKAEYPDIPLYTAVLVDVERLRLSDGVSPDVAAMTTDILNVKFGWGCPDFSKHLHLAQKEKPDD